MRAPKIVTEFESRFGAGSIVTDPDQIEALGTDIYGGLDAAAAIVRPKSQAQLIEMVELAAQARTPLFVRGGGASYTLSHVPSRPDGLVIDTSTLNRIIEINETDMTVTVEPGVTWSALDAALKAKDLRTPFWGPFSGLQSTIGGSLSQHAISLGSGLYDTSSSIVTGLKVITGNGGVIDTGTTPDRFYRTYGPDLAGLFLGDSGAFGIKLEMTLKLIKRPTHVQGATMIYDRFDDLAWAMTAAAKENLASEILAIDPQLQQGQLGNVDVNDMFETARAILSSSPGLFSGLSALFKAAFGARQLLNKPGFMLNLTAEGRSNREAQAKLATIRNTIAGRGIEVVNTMALALRATPFRPLTPILGPKGERWLPMHCVLPFSQVGPFHAALEAYYASRKAEMDAHDIRIATMFLTVGSNGFVYEPTFYWLDSQHAAHRELAPSEHRESLPTYPDNPEARAVVTAMKKDMIGLMQSHGATHYQIGKSYPFMSTREPGAGKLLKLLKSEFDPHDIINPGALEF